MIIINSDNFGLRENLVSLLKLFKGQGIYECFVPDKVIIGQKRNGMYLLGDFYKIKQDYTRENYILQRN